ncbi:S8 family serine peptidase [Deinococcus sp. QL22]|uniref:S8 family serine peptidase n=1 Tax=Deinococcus sp. QL22 TaxID=2939437 RepID=UPI002016BC44|nr:S8 family serine peptidase [Deinococcus sp. QL22]UQN05651.1 S8 family serine peptidase [Deinococcus sp. QL22]
MSLNRALLAATLALSLAACSQQNAAAPDASTPDLSSSGNYLVGFKESPLNAQGLDTQALEAQAVLQAQAVTAAGGTLKQQWADISAAAVQLSPSALAALKANPNVEYVELEAVHHALGGPSGSLTREGGSPALSSQALKAQAIFNPSGEYTWGDNALGVPQLLAEGKTGVGVAVCIGDTGIDANHPEFARKLKGYKNFVTTDVNREDPYKLNDVDGHGTHVAGTVFAQLGGGAAAKQPGMDAGGVIGVATGVNLYMARVLGDSGSGSSSGIINGVNWCAARLTSQGQGGTESKVVISLSLGGGRASQTEQRAYTAAHNKGVLIIAATGNDGAAVSYPAAYTNVVGIGATDANNAKASFSNFGTQVDLVGPGVSVLSSVPLGKGTAASVTALSRNFTEVTSADLSGKGTVTGTVVVAGGTNNEFCGTTANSAAINGKIALIKRGTCTFEEKTANAVRNGAIGVLIYNNAAGAPGIGLTNAYTTPVVGITQVDGEALLAAITPTTAPTATLSVTGADYAYFDGTSMATPHVSAAAAVVWAAKPTLTNTGLLNLLTSTATDLGTAGKDNNFGHGLVNPLKAISVQ